jgi:anti-anti-sigma factor
MLEVRETTFPDTTLLVLTGQFVYHSTARIETLILGAQELGHKQITLDFSGITGIDSIVLWHLFLWYHKMQPHGVKLFIVNPQPRIREVLEQSHNSDLIPISSADLEAVNQNGTPQ